MRTIHKYNLRISVTMMIVSMINLFTVNEPIVHAIIFGYIYSCMWTFIGDKLDAKEVNDE